MSDTNTSKDGLNSINDINKDTDSLIENVSIDLEKLPRTYVKEIDFSPEDAAPFTTKDELKKHPGITKLKSGYYSYRVTYYHDGKRKEKQGTTDQNGNKFETIAQAEKERNIQKAILQTKSGDFRNVKKKTVNQIWEDFLINGKSQKAATRRKHCAVYDNHIKNVFGSRIASSLTPDEINVYIQKIYNEGDNYDKDYDTGYSYG